MESIMRWLTLDAPVGWEDVIVRAVKVALIGFVVLQAKEYIDAGSFDTLATATDAVLIAGASALVNAISIRPKSQRPGDRR